MKHLLNNLSKEEKQSILEKHGGGMKVFAENFRRLVGHKSGTILNEQISECGDVKFPFELGDVVDMICSHDKKTYKIKFYNPELNCRATADNITLSYRAEFIGEFPMLPKPDEYFKPPFLPLFAKAIISQYGETEFMDPTDFPQEKPYLYSVSNPKIYFTKA